MLVKTHNMTETTLDKIKALIENSKSFGILLDSNPEEHELLLKEILKEVIASKNIPVVSFPKDPEGFREKWSEILKEENNFVLPQKTSIKIPKEKYKIEEVSFREDEKNISLVINSSQNDLAMEDLTLEKLPPEADVVFCFFEDEERLEKFNGKINIPKREKTIFIKSSEKTLTNKIFDILKIFDPNIQTSKEKMTVLFASLVTETNNFSEKTTKESFSLANFLIENRAETKTISKIIEKEKKTSTAQLVGRILARTHIDEFFGISWSFLNSRDLQKTNNTSIPASDLYKLLRNMRTFIPQQNLHVLLWQTTKGINALITASENKSREYLAPFAKKTRAQLQNKFFITGPFESFSEAEKHLRQSFKEEINKVFKNYIENNTIIR